MSHANAALTPVGREKLVNLVINKGWGYRRVAERFQCSSATAARWVARAHTGEGITDRSSRPVNSPRRFSQARERRIIGLRFTRRWGTHRIGYGFDENRSTIERVLNRYGMPELAHLDHATGLPVRGAPIVRYERDHPGDLIRVDIKKQGRFPPGGGHRALGRERAPLSHRGLGYAFLRHAVDDNYRLAYSEILDNEREESAAGFWQRANGCFTRAGIRAQSVMTDNGSCYQSRAFTEVLDYTVAHLFTRPYRHQTNVKVERFNQTLAQKWAYARTCVSEEERAAAYPVWLHYYNHHRSHTGLGELQLVCREPMRTCKLGCWVSAVVNDPKS